MSAFREIAITEDDGSCRLTVAKRYYHDDGPEPTFDVLLAAHEQITDRMLIDSLLRRLKSNEDACAIDSGQELIAALEQYIE